MSLAVRVFGDFLLAFSQLTAIPVTVRWPDDGVPDAAGWFPLVGALVGLASALCVAAVARFTALSFLGLAPGFVWLVVGGLLTGFLHWDGLADVFDAWGVPDAARRLEVMHDSRIGTFGTLAIVFVAIGTTVAVSSLMQLGIAIGGLVLVVSAMLSRCAATFAAWLGTPARVDGLGASVARRPGVSGGLGAAVTVAMLVSIVVLGDSRGAGVLLAALCGVGLFIALVVPHVISGRFGGVTGDVMGASIILTELGIIISAQVLVRLPMSGVTG